MVEFKTQYGRMELDPSMISRVEMDGNLTVLVERPSERYSLGWGGTVPRKFIVSDSYSEAMRKLGRNV